MSVTAEGVETTEQLLLLRADQCEEIQGFLTGRLCPEEEPGSVMAGAGPTIAMASAVRSGA